MTTTQTRRALTDERTPASSERRLQFLTANAYRTLGLASRAAQKEIYEAAASVRRAARLGVEKRTACDALWLGALVRTENTLRDAEGRLARPAQRIFERLFWFYETESIVELDSLAALDARLDELHARLTPSAQHDAALLSYAAALRFDGEIYDAALWEKTFALWREVVAGDAFWPLLLAADLKGDFEQLVTHAEIRELRQRAWRLVTMPVVEAAKDAVLEKDYEACGRAMAVLRAADLPPKLLTEYENEVFGSIEDEFEASCRQVFSPLLHHSVLASSRSQHLSACNEALRRFKDQLRPFLRRIYRMAGVSSRVMHRSCETAARHLAQLAAAYLSSDCRPEGLALLGKAYALAPPASEAELLIEETLRRYHASEKIVERTEEEYSSSLAWQLRPQTEMFAAYEAELPASSPVQASAKGGCISTLAEVVVPVILLMLCGFCMGGGKSRRSPTRPAVNLMLNQNRPQHQPTPNLNLNLNTNIIPIPPPLTTIRVPPSRAWKMQDAGRAKRRGAQGNRPARTQPRDKSDSVKEGKSRR